MSNMPRPYLMCSEHECRDRQESREVSEWEATAETFDKNHKYRKLDPCLAVAKYRRSAAGTQHRPPRRLAVLHATWKHLCDIVVHRKIHPNQCPRSLAAAVSFVDDRIRAIQVDLVVSQQVSAEIQIQFVRYHLTMLYLLSNVPPQAFQPKFARLAFMTAIVAYWDDADHKHDDEILAYTTLCRVAASISDFAWVESDEILATYRQRSIQGVDYPKFMKALQIAAAAHREQYYIVLKLLSKDDSPFMYLCRLCMAPCLNKIRWLCLNQYNKAYMKREKVHPEEIARLLFLPDAEAAVDFCALTGLPYEEERIIFKTAPVKELESYSISRKLDDWFCLGANTACQKDADGVGVPNGEFLLQLIL